MSFSISIGGHAATKEAEAEIVKVLHKLWAEVEKHAEPGVWGNIHTAHHGVGHPNAITDPDNPDKNVTVDEDGNRHLDVPVAPSSTSSGGSTEATAPAPDSYSTPSSSLPPGGAAAQPATVDSAADKTPESAPSGSEAATPPPATSSESGSSGFAADPANKTNPPTA